MKKIPKQAYTTEFKELAVKRVTDGASIAVVMKELGIGDQTLRNWVKATAEGKLKGAGNKVVTPEAMELSRLRAEVARLKRENDIIKKQRRTLLEMFCEVRLDRRQQQGLCADRHVCRTGRLHQRLSRMETGRYACSQTAHGRANTGGNPRHPCRTQRRLRQSTYGA